jgi:hypothetical protein
VPRLTFYAFHSNILSFLHKIGPVNLEVFPPPKIVKFITRFYNAIAHKYEQDEPFANMPEIA